MKSLTATFVAVVSLVILSGCASIQTASQKDLNGEKLTTTTATDIAHVNGSTFGIYLLSIPLMTGCTENPGNLVFGKDTVKLGPVVSMVTKKSKDIGATKTVDMTSSCSSLMLPFPIPFLFYIKSVEVSGNAVK